MKYHSERSEESCIFNNLRSFTAFRMTENTGFEIASMAPFYVDRDQGGKIAFAGREFGEIKRQARGAGLA